ncbi:MAG: FtsB family cell division protein [Ilumatobacteraceae bacterium]
MAAKRGSATKRAQTKKSTRVKRGDLTRPTPRQERLVPKRVGYVVLALGMILIVGSFANSFLVLPVKSWFGQRTEFEDRSAELEALQEATDRLQTEVDRLNTPEGVEDAARDELGFVMVGENRRTVVGDASAPVDLPWGWPYDLVEEIVRVREAEVQARSSNSSDDSLDTTSTG